MLIANIKSAASRMLGLTLLGGVAVLSTWQSLAGQDKPPQRPLRVDPPHISTDKTVKYDYDIIYVRAPRVVEGTERPAPVWPNAAEPGNLRAPTDLMVLHPDG